MNVEKLLAPIAPDRPSGDSLRYEGTFDRIQEARFEDDAQLEQGPWKKKVTRRADWPVVARLCAEALETRTKDIQVAVWLLEAWVQLHGFTGLREGLVLVRELCARFWDTVHPAIEDDDVEARLGPLYWLNEKFSLRIAHLVVTRPVEGTAYTLGDLERARMITDQSARDRTVLAAAEAEGAATDARITESAAATPIEFYRAMLAQVHGAFDAVSAIERFVDAQCGAEAPSLRLLRQRLSLVEEVAAREVDTRTPAPAPEPVIEPEPEPAPAPAVIVPEPVVARPPAPVHAARVEEDLRMHQEDAVDDLDAVAPVGRALVPTEPAAMAPAAPEIVVVERTIETRADAYRQLEAAAAFLMRLEPHSPTPYLVMRAVAWEHKSLVEILPDLIRDERLLGELSSYLGHTEGKE